MDNGNVMQKLYNYTFYDLRDFTVVRKGGRGGI